VKKGQNIVKYVKKGEGAEKKEGENEGKEKAEEETKEKPEKPKRQRKIFEYVEVTLETVIPPLPKKSERLKEPNEGDYWKEVQKMDDEINMLWDNYKNLRNEIKTAMVEKKGKNEHATIREIFMKKIEEQKKIFEEFKAKKEELKEMKDSIEEIVFFFLSS